MAVEVVMPAMEMGQESALVVRWLKNEGDPVTAGEPLIEIETDKVTVEIEAPATGTLAGIAAAAGDDVPVGTTIALIMAAGEAAPDRLGPAKERVLASPKARRLAAEAGVDLASLSAGSGRPLRSSDIASAAAAVTPTAGAYRVVPLDGVRKRVAERLTASYQEAPHIALRRSVDATRLLASLEELWTAKRPASIMAGIAFACAQSLAAHPLLNAHFVDSALRVFDEVGLGIAVALDEGLIVPVLHDARRKTIPALAAEIGVLAEQARSGALAPGDVRDGTFTITNLGMFAVDDFTPILNPPQVGILAIGALRNLPADVGGVVGLRPTISLTLVVDHRAIDGAVAASYLTDLVASLELGESREQAVDAKGADHVIPPV